MMSRPLPENLPNLGKNFPPQSLDFRAIIAAIYEPELLKTAVQLALLVAIAIFFQESAIQLGLGLDCIMFLLSMGCRTIWSGIFLRQTHPRAAFPVERVGMGLVVLAFNMVMASVAPKWFVWCFPVLYFGIFILPLVMVGLPRLAAG